MSDKEARKQLISDYEFFKTAAGKRVLADLADRASYKHSMEHLVGYASSERTAFELGKRELYVYIVDKTEADPEAEIQESAETD